MDNLLINLSQWLSDEREILDQYAHDVATADTVEDMVTAKQAYVAQNIKVETIEESIRFAEFAKKIPLHEQEN